MSDDDRNKLVAAYLDSGYAVAKELALAYGVSPRYVSKLLRQRKIPNVTKRGAKPGGVRSVNDPRWARAIAIGPVIA